MIDFKKKLVIILINFLIKLLVNIFFTTNLINQIFTFIYLNRDENCKNNVYSCIKYLEIK